jgi:DmsE family decaheme c-type cytochrome
MGCSQIAVVEAQTVLSAGNSGDAVCTRCHDAKEKKPTLSIYRTRHGVAGQPGCQACHGSSRPHVRHADDSAERPPPDFVFNGPNRSSPDIQSRSCLNCHDNGQRNHWRGSAHPGNDLTCSNCHKVHETRDKLLAKDSEAEVCFTCHKAERAQIHYLSAHPIAAGKMTCSNCHNPHGTTSPKLLVKNTINETCYTCHAEKRGPFLWEHPPASDDCSNCHLSHGSNIAPLLKVRPPWLCQGCHAGDQHPTPAFSGRGLPTQAGGTAPSQQLLLRACVNCHSAIHGSNHPSGPRFTR